MEKIFIKKKEENDDGWVFGVEVGGAEYRVGLAREYWEKLTGKTIEPEKLVLRSFKFLLAREPKESILGQFDLSVIQKYFPEYEDKIKC